MSESKAKRRTPRRQDQRPRVEDPLQRRKKIAEAAYFKAERRGFVAGYAERDWLDAEKEINGEAPAS